jgi:predicted nucleic acid-binding protein
VTLYFDTAYVAKCYLNEPDGKRVRKLARSAVGLVSSIWCIAELSCVFHRHVQEESLTPRQAVSHFDLFLADVRHGVWNLLPLGHEVLSRAAEIAVRLPPAMFLRGGDAIHLASARDAGFQEIWSSDRHLLAAASHFHLNGRSV